ncbi:hypothetical protein L3X38_034785 [Prunus dulcis]|uniref:Transmembrane protein n=1 Tax=Prunus dulcis TaxID=3755 RepID=A0AAD4VKQ6_PRUDU|nr:hypothetical protein L3X38_034785 [Prunus dulcis]
MKRSSFLEQTFKGTKPNFESRVLYFPKTKKSRVLCKRFGFFCLASKEIQPQVLYFPVLRFSWLSFIFAFVSLAARVQKTLQGSSDDIGWLPRALGMPGVEDGTARFLELLAGIRNGEHILLSSFVYLLIPGLYGNHGIVYFVGTKKFFSKMDLARHIAKIQSEASVEHNAWELKQYMRSFTGNPVSV